jgi:hypothetical protein
MHPRKRHRLQWQRVAQTCTADLHLAESQPASREYRRANSAGVRIATLARSRPCSRSASDVTSGIRKRREFAVGRIRNVIEFLRMCLPRKLILRAEERRKVFPRQARDLPQNALGFTPRRFVPDQPEMAVSDSVDQSRGVTSRVERRSTKTFVSRMIAGDAPPGSEVFLLRSNGLLIRPCAC